MVHCLKGGTNVLGHTDGNQDLAFQLELLGLSAEVADKLEKAHDGRQTTAVLDVCMAVIVQVVEAFDFVEEHFVKMFPQGGRDGDRPPVFVLLKLEVTGV